MDCGSHLRDVFRTARVGGAPADFVTATRDAATGRGGQATAVTDGQFETGAQR